MRPISPRHSAAFQMGQERQIRCSARHLPGLLCHRSGPRLGCQQHQCPCPAIHRQRPTQAGDTTASRGTPHQERSHGKDRPTPSTILPAYRTHGHPRTQSRAGMVPCPGRQNLPRRTRHHRRLAKANRRGRLHCSGATADPGEQVPRLHPIHRPASQGSLSGARQSQDRSSTGPRWPPPWRHHRWTHAQSNARPTQTRRGSRRAGHGRQGDTDRHGQSPGPRLARGSYCRSSRWILGALVALRPATALALLLVAGRRC